jgi:hypothetical protein
MRRFTLITIIGLFVVLTAATIYQVVLVQGEERRFPGPGLTGGDDRIILRDLTGELRGDAIDTLREVGLAYRVMPAGDAPLDDRVVAQSPSPGTLLEEDAVVTLEVRCRPKPCPAPGEGEEIVDPCSCATA